MSGNTNAIASALAVSTGGEALACWQLLHFCFFEPWINGAGWCHLIGDGNLCSPLCRPSGECGHCQCAGNIIITLLLSARSGSARL